MSIDSTPAPARTDLPAATLPRVSRPSRTAGTDAAPAISDRRIRRSGLALTAGALAWSATMATFGPTAGGIGGRLGDLGGLAFQAGVFALLHVQLRTRATGTSKAAVRLIKVEHVLLGLAALWSLLHAITPETGWLVFIDPFWPLSMLGMFVIGIKIAFTGRWRGALRVWPVVAESWAVVSVPSFLILGERANYVGALHLVVGYATLGAILALRPQLARADA